MQQPLVSVIIPTYNRSTTLGRAIRSVLNQTYPDVELIVVDDGSTDDTVSILGSYGERIRWMSQQQSGPSAARNTGARLATGKFLSFLDSDDCWESDKIAIQVDLLLRSGEQVPCCICDALIIDPNGSQTTSFSVAGVDCSLERGYWTNPELVIATRFILFNQVALIWRSAFEAVGGFCEDLKLLEDHDLAFRLACLGPWGFDERQLVKKYNETLGIGVTAMRDQLCHAIAWQQVISRCVRWVPDSERALLSLISRSLLEANIEVLCLTSIRDCTEVKRWVARLRLAALRFHQKLNRRGLCWPRVKCAPTLLPAIGA